MKTKSEKRNEARKNAESVKAARKAQRQTKTTVSPTANVKKGKSVIPQGKAKAKR